MGKKRAGGGAKAFMKSVLTRGEPEKEEEADPGATQAPNSEPACEPTSAPTDAGAAAAAAQEAAAQPQAASGALAAASEPPAHETKGQMQQRHKRELKAVKEAVKKLGRKRKEEGDKLEADTTERHTAELAALEAGAPPTPVGDGSDAGAEALVAQSLYGVAVSDGSGGKAEKKESSRAQKRREKATQQQAEREARIAAEQAEMGDSERVVEEAALAALLAPHGLMLRDIPPDGNCLYRALEDQLAAEAESCGSGPRGHEELRAAAADYMRSHEKEFAPFVLPEAEGGADVHEQFARYCDAMAASAVWGGQAELGALAHVLRRRIDVYSAGMPTVAMGEEYSDEGPLLRISYQRHAYELGEHYNSVVPAPTAATNGGHGGLASEEEE